MASTSVVYSQAIYRDYYESQRFDITNNVIHDNVCADQSFVGAGFALNNMSGTIKGNVIADNSCGRGDAGFLNDSTNQNTISIEQPHRTQFGHGARQRAWRWALSLSQYAQHCQQRFH